MNENVIINSVDDIYLQERSSLYNFVLRMTNDPERAFNSMEEVHQAVSFESSKIADRSFEDIRALLYQTARSFNSDIWNKSKPAKPPRQGSETSFDSLNAMEKEYLLLRYQVNFSVELTNSILELQTAKAANIDERLTEAIKQQFEMSPSQFMKDLPFLTMPDDDNDEALALSEIMEQVKKSRQKPLPNLEKVFMVIFIIFACILFWFIGRES